MGEYFLMSYHFNKETAIDFGLYPIDENTAINLNDNSLWKKSNLYDFGWGQECGYIKLPLPDRVLLFDIVLHSTSKDDVYGSASMILKDYPEELLRLCEDLISKNRQNGELKRLIKVFNLKTPINRSKTTGKDFSQICNDFERWKYISKKTQTIRGRFSDCD